MSLYEYKPIDLATDAIRLIHLAKGYGTDPIYCRMFETFLSDSEGVTYEALSYTWDTLERPAQIILDGSVLPVTENLHLALCSLRSPQRDRLLWIDAICIDQDNEKERGHQVGQMKEIYTNAEHVIIWLGPSCKEIDLLVDFTVKIHERARISEENWLTFSESWELAWPIMNHGLDENLKDALCLLLEHPWFERVWVIQEAASARTATIMCGPKSMSTDIFTQLPRLLDVTPSEQIQAILDIMPGSHRKTTWWKHNRDLFTLSRKFRYSKATDRRDNIYALLGISSDASDIAIYRPCYEKWIQEVVMDFISFVIFGKTVDSSSPALPQWTFEEMDRHITPDNLRHEVLRWAIYDQQEQTAIKILSTKNIDVNWIYDFNHIDSLYKEDSILTLIARTKPMLTFLALFLDDERVNPDVCGKEGRTALSWASENGFLTTAQMLLDRGADVNAVDQHGQTPLRIALLCARMQMVKLLLENGVDTSLNDEHHGTPLLWIVGHAYVILFQSFITNSQGIWVPPTVEIIQQESVALFEAVSILLDKGADTSVRDQGGRTPLSWASGNGLLPVVKMLCDQGADVNSTDVEGRTPLSWAAENGFLEVVKMLLDFGAVATLEDDRGKTPLMWAEAHERAPVAEVLRMHSSPAHHSIQHAISALLTSTMPSTGVPIQESLKELLKQEEYKQAIGSSIRHFVTLYSRE